MLKRIFIVLYLLAGLWAFAWVPDLLETPNLSVKHITFTALPLAVVLILQFVLVGFKNPKSF